MNGTRIVLALGVAAIVAAGAVLALRTSEPQPAEAPTAADEAPAGPKIGDPPPQLGAGGRALDALARHYGVGLVQCPLDEVGKVARVHGTARDSLRKLGPTYLADIDPLRDAPWDPLYDVGVVEDGWLVTLAVPGSTSGLFRPYGRTLKLTWPEAVAGETVSCTRVEVISPRQVQGRVIGPEADRSALAGCNRAEPLAGGVVDVEVDVPCTLWAEARGHRSAPLRVEPGDEPLAVELTLVDDPAWTVEGLTPAGRQTMAAALDAEIERQQLHLTALEGLAAQLEVDRDVAKQLGRWRRDQEGWLNEVRRVRVLLERMP